MAYDKREIEREFSRQLVKKERPPPKELSDDAARKRLEKDVYLLLTKTKDRELFVKEVEKLTARYGLRTGLEQLANARRLYDQYQNEKQKPSR